MPDKQLKQFGLTLELSGKGKFDHFMSAVITFVSPILIPKTKKRIQAHNDSNTGTLRAVGSKRVFSAAAYSRTKTKLITQAGAKFKGNTSQSHSSFRHHCAEFQLLNSFYFRRKTIIKNDAEQFTVQLWTEKAPCASCAQVISEFMLYFSNANLIVHHLWPDKLHEERASWSQFASRIKMIKARKSF